MYRLNYSLSSFRKDRLIWAVQHRVGDTIFESGQMECFNRILRPGDATEMNFKYRKTSLFVLRVRLRLDNT
jgi:hypothetical protein